MSGPEEIAVSLCSGCGASLVTNARFCAHCGLPADAARGDESVPLDQVGPGARSAAPDPATSIDGRAHRKGVPEWLAVVAGVAAVLSAWFIISRPSGDTRTIDDAAPSIGESADPTESEVVESVPSTFPPASSSSSTTSGSAPTPQQPTPDDDDAAESSAEPPASVGNLDADGWRLLVGDGLTIVEVDLGTGDQARHDSVGAPIAMVDGRLLVYRNSRLAWFSPDDLDRSLGQIVEVPALQRMFTRGRSADRPVVVEEGTLAAVWWPNNNANPQTWVKLDLADGAVIDSIALAEPVFGGPEVVATVGSGTFERVDGRWVRVGDLFASSASHDAVVGQQCRQPDDCDWVLQRRGEAAGDGERLPIPVGGPFDVRLVADADRVLLLESDGVTDHGTGRFVPMVAANATTLTATNRANVLAMADGAGIGPRVSPVTVVDLDGRPDRSVVEIAVSELIPRWLVLVPPR